MKISVKETEERVMRVLIKNSYKYNEVEVGAEDMDGVYWVIATISEKGITLHGGIAVDTGWPLDSEGRLLLNS